MNHLCSKLLGTLEVLAGTNNLFMTAQRYNVRNYFMHQNYSSESNKNDVAVIRIDGKFEFNSRVQPIELAKEEIPDDSVLKFTG